jgi:hypothetical protein
MACARRLEVKHLSIECLRQAVKASLCKLCATPVQRCVVMSGASCVRTVVWMLCMLCHVRKAMEKAFAMNPSGLTRKQATCGRRYDCGNAWKWRADSSSWNSFTAHSGTLTPCIHIPHACPETPS